GEFRNAFVPDEEYTSIAQWLADWLIAGYLADKHATGLSAKQLDLEIRLAREEADKAKEIVRLSNDVNERRDAGSAQSQAEARAKTLQQRLLQVQAGAAARGAGITNATRISSA